MMLLLCALVAGSSNVWADDILTLNCASAAASSGSTSFSSTSDVATFLNSAAGLSSAEKKITCSGKTGDVYNGKGSGGGDIPQQCLKVGKASGGGGITFTIPDTYDEVGEVEITCYGWKTSSSISINSGTAQTFTTAQEETTKTFELASATRQIAISVTSSAVCITSIVLKKKATVATPTFSPVAGTYTSAQSVTISCTTTGADIYYTKGDSPADPTKESTKYTGAITVDATTTIKAIAINGSDASSVASATYTIVSIEHAGTEADPYSVADARTAIDANTGITEVYATGTVSEIVTPYNSTYENITFNISTDGITTSNQLQAYRCKGATGIDVSEVQEGDVVVVKGNLLKHGETYEFAEACEVTSISHPTTPLIVVTPNSLTGFTYGLGFGPSETQTFSVEGSNLTADISLSLGESNYEMSLTEGSGYTNSLTLTQTAGAVAATTVYVRLKADLAINASYSGNVALTSTDATAKAVSLEGSVTQPNFTWDLSKKSYSAASENEVTWSDTYATMVLEKGKSSNNANNYLGGDANSRTSSRFYKDQNLTLTPAAGYTITSIVFTATSDSYATALKNSSWTNATASVSSTTVTVTPTNGLAAISASIGGTCGFTAVKVFFEAVPPVPVTITDAEYATYCNATKALDFSATGITVYTATDGKTSVALNEVASGQIPANTPVVLYKAGGGAAINVPIIASADAPAGTNDLHVSTGTDVANMYVLSKIGGKVGFYPWGGTNLSAGKIYLQGKASYGAREFIGFGDATSIDSVTRDALKNGKIYNLQGQEVKNATKGIFIVNGKKVFLK